MKAKKPKLKTVKPVKNMLEKQAKMQKVRKPKALGMLDKSKTKDFTKIKNNVS